MPKIGSRRGSGTCRSRSSSDDATDNGSAATAATDSAVTEPRREFGFPQGQIGEVVKQQD
jgi:hypothetical protein